MINKLKELQKISQLLNPYEYKRNEWNKEVFDYANSFINELESSKAYIRSTEEENNYSTFEISDNPTQLGQLLGSVKENIDAIGINPASPSHMGYIPGGGLYPSALGDYIAAVSNRYAGIFYAAPGAVRLENSLIKWMNDLMGYTITATGNLTSGGSIANLIAVVTARESHNIKAKDIENIVIYLSEQAHHSILKAIRIAGLSEAKIRYIPLDNSLRLSVKDLESAIVRDKSNGLSPFFINATVGTTNNGAIDPINDIAKIAAKHQIWLHVDACYGGFFKLLPAMKTKFRGIEKADSITLDPHKTLFLSFGSGAILIKDKERAKKAFHHLADYMQDTVSADDEISPSDVSPELTKHYRGMRLWLPLKLFGLAPFRAALEEKLLLTQYFCKKLKKMNRFELGPEPELSIAMFRFVPKHVDANAFNSKLITSIQNDGRVFLSSTTVNNIFWIRVAIVVFRTHLEHIDQLLEIIENKTLELVTSDNLTA